MMRNWVATLVFSGILISSTAFADDLLGKKGGGKSGGGSNPPKSGGGVKTDPPPKKGGGGDDRTSPPPKRGGGEDRPIPPPRRGGGGNDDLLNKGSGGRSGGGSRDSGDRVDRGGQGDDRTIGDLVDREGRRGGSRSGEVGYGSRSNLFGRDRSELRFDSDLPRGMDRLVGRQDRVREHDSRDWDRDRDRYRRGYYAYNSRWTDDYFYYPYYRFTWGRDAFPSPWYYYPHLPAYIYRERLTPLEQLFRWLGGERYNYRGYSSWNDNSWGRDDDWSRGYGDRGEGSLDDVLISLERAFERGRFVSMDELIPRSGRVRVELQDEWSYSMSSDDFYDMMRDLVENTRTRSYRITDVQVGRQGVRVQAVHDFVDPWRSTERVTHTYLLQESRWGYVITYFRTEGNSRRR